MKPHNMIKPVVAHPCGNPHLARKLVDLMPASVIAWVDVIRITNRPRAMSMYGIRPDFRRDGSDPARQSAAGTRLADRSVHPVGIAARRDGDSITVVDRNAAATPSPAGLIEHPLAFV
jgi:hypothetical protein